MAEGGGTEAGCREADVSGEHHPQAPQGGDLVAAIFEPQWLREEAPKRGAKRQASEANIIHKLRSEAFWLLPID
jgi:hypothetical protein